MIDEWGEKILIWLMEGPEARYNRGANPGTRWGSLEPYRRNILKQPWMSTTRTNRMWSEDRDALLGWLVEHGILSEEQRMWLDVKHTLALMEG